MSQQTVAETFNNAVQASGEGRSQDAEAGFRAVLAADPDHAEALFGLGLTLMTARRFNEAVQPLRSATVSPAADAVWLVCLGQALYLTGDFSGAVEVFDRAACQGPLPANADQVRARAAALAAIINGVVIEDALSLYSANPEEELSVAREAFAVFSAFGQLDAAAARSAPGWPSRSPRSGVVRRPMRCGC